MSAFDWLLLSILAYSTVRALLHGIILELFSLAGLIAGVLLAAWNNHHFAVILGRIAPAAGSAAEPVSFFLILAAVLLLVALAGRLIHRTAHAAGLGLFDRILGGCFGLLRGCLFVIALLIGIAAFSPQFPGVVDSRLSPYFLAGAHAVSFVVPHNLQLRIRNGVAHINHNEPDWIKPPR